MIKKAPAKTPAQPIPISTRASNNSGPDGARANSKVPITVNRNSPMTISRGPNRSSSNPVGICITA